MSSGVNIKVMSQTQNDTTVSSSLPLPRSMMPFVKMDPKQQYSGLPNPTLQYQHAAKTQPSYFSSSVSSGSTELLRGAVLKNPLLQPKHGIYSPRAPAATERTNGTCSAYSSPQAPKRDIQRSKDTLDLRTSTLTQKAFRELQVRRNVNKNWTFGKHRLSNVDNAHEGDASCRPAADVHGAGCLLYNKGANGNEITEKGNIRKDTRNIANEYMEASKGEMSSNKSKHSYQTFNMSGKVNMAAVAPYRFRFQIQEDASLDDLSDCSSDSMEVCCDDLGESL
ncbi:hypothetical protein LDENG_00110560 [Lucifuga dentata]|nr:hypothetical protein LDENG_00110560 [Lucifuga dentata]